MKVNCHCILEFAVKGGQAVTVIFQPLYSYEERAASVIGISMGLTASQEKGISAHCIKQLSKEANRITCTYRLDTSASHKVVGFYVHLSFVYASVDRLCGLVVRVLGYRSGGRGSVPGTTRKKSSGSGTGSTQPRAYN
jgi:hypothetical protein